MRSYPLYLLTCAVFVAGLSPITFAPQRTIHLPIGMSFAWTANATNNSLVFAVTAPTVSGWVGFGVGEGMVGSMPGSDVMIAWTDSVDGHATVGDYYAKDFSTPVFDCAGEQDWILQSSSQNATHSMYEVRRSLTATNSQQDRPIDPRTPTRLLFAYGSSAASVRRQRWARERRHEPQNRTAAQARAGAAYHGANRLLTNEFLFTTTPQSTPAAAHAARGVPHATVSLYQDGFAVPTARTTYHDSACFAMPGPHANGSSPFIIGFQASTTAANRRYVHHIVAHGYKSRAGCDRKSQTQKVDVWAVAYALEPFVFPPDVGIPCSAYPYMRFEVHYDNPEAVAGVRDNTTVDVFYTYSAISNPAGILQLGDGTVNEGRGIPVGASSYTYECTSDCTRENFNANLTVFGELMHMHALGAYFETTVYPNETAATPTLRLTAEYYSGDAQQNRMFDPPFVIRRGNRVRTRCVFKNTGTRPVGFGTSSDEEMCIHFLYYYPLQSLVYCGGGPSAFGVCGATVAVPQSDTDTLPSVAALQHNFGRADNAVCPNRECAAASITNTMYDAPLTACPSFDACAMEACAAAGFPYSTDVYTCLSNSSARIGCATLAGTIREYVQCLNAAALADSNGTISGCQAAGGRNYAGLGVQLLRSEYAGSPAQLSCRRTVCRILHATGRAGGCVAELDTAHGDAFVCFSEAVLTPTPVNATFALATNETADSSAPPRGVHAAWMIALLLLSVLVAVAC